MAVKCKCDSGGYRRYGDEIAGRKVAQAMHLDACINCGYVPTSPTFAQVRQPPVSQKKLLGDRVSDAFERVGVDKVTKAITKATGFDCGCNKRREQLNEFSRKHGKP